MQKEQYYTEIEKLVHKKRSLRCSLVTVGLKDTQGKKVCREILVKTFIQALQECQNTKMKKIHLGNQKFPPSTGRPNCQNQAVWPACVRWQLLIPWMNFFHFSVLAFLQGLSKCFHLNLPLYFFFALFILQTHSELHLRQYSVQITFEFFFFQMRGFYFSKSFS